MKLSNSIKWIFPALLIAAALLTFANSIDNGFHLDDYYRVVNNPGIQKLSPIWRHFTDPHTSSSLERIVQFRPLLPLSLSVDYYLYGENGFYFHLTNLFLHVLTILAVYALALELFGHWHGGLEEQSPRTPSFITALLFAVHPVSGIPVNYICARDLLLMQLFLVLCLLSYVRMRRQGFSALRWTFCLGAFALSLLSKTNFVVAPLLIFAFELLLNKQVLRNRPPWLCAAPFAAIVALFFAYTRWVLKFSDLQNVQGSEYGPWSYFLTQARLSVTHYLRNFFWPVEIRQLPLIEAATSLTAGVWVGILFALGTLVLAWQIKGRAALLSWAIFSYWILMLPESSFVPLHHLAVDYRPYPSSLFFYISLWHLGSYLLSRRWAVLLFVLYAMGMAGGSWYQNKTWKSDSALWAQSVRYGGDAIAHMNYAMSFSDRNDPRVRFHMEESLRIAPWAILPHINLGLLLIDLGDPVKGLALCEKAVELGPDWAQAHYWLAQAYEKVDRATDAAASAAKAAELEPRNFAYLMLAAVYAQQVKDYTGSLVIINKLIAMDADYEEALFVRGYAQQMLGDNDAAIADYKIFLSRSPTHTTARFNLGFAYLTKNRCQEAVIEFKQIPQDDSTYEEAHEYIEKCAQVQVPS